MLRGILRLDVDGDAIFCCAGGGVNLVVLIGLVAAEEPVSRATFQEAIVNTTVRELE